MATITVLVGGPGCGKGASGKGLLSHLPLGSSKIFTMSDELRRYSIENPDFDKKYGVTTAMQGHTLVSDEAISIVATDFSQKFHDYRNVIVDGAIRTKRQVKEMVGIAIEGAHYLMFIILQCEDDIMVNRMITRGRPGEGITEIRKRIAEYREHESEIIEGIIGSGAPFKYIAGDDTVGSIAVQMVEFVYCVAHA